MNKILWASILVMLTPLTGLPLFWKSVVLFLTGLFIFIQTFLLKEEFYKIKKQDKGKDLDRIFVENESRESEF